MQSINLCKEVLENAIGVHETCEKSGMEMQPLDVVAVQAMKELLQYREIGEVSTCRNAVEICRAMIERGIEPDNIMEYIKFEDNLVQRGYDLKRLLEMMEEHKQYREIGTPEELQTMKEHGGFTGVELAQIAAGQMKLKEYRAIGTPEECRAAIEKQTARRSLHQGCYDKDGVWHEWNGINGKPYELCPSCGVNLCCMMPINKKPNYCKECGQKLDWNRRANDGETD